MDSDQSTLQYGPLCSRVRCDIQCTVQYSAMGSTVQFAVKCSAVNIAGTDRVCGHKYMNNTQWTIDCRVKYSRVVVLCIIVE